VRPRPVLALLVGGARLLAACGGDRLGAAVRELDKVFGRVVDSLEVVRRFETTVEVVHVVVVGALRRRGGVESSPALSCPTITPLVLNAACCTVVLVASPSKNVLVSRCTLESQPPETRPSSKRST